MRASSAGNNAAPSSPCLGAPVPAMDGADARAPCAGADAAGGAVLRADWREPEAGGPAGARFTGAA